MGFPLNLQATPDINTPGLISDTGGDDRQNDGARQLLAQEFGQRGAPGQKFVVGPKVTAGGAKRFPRRSKQAFRRGKRQAAPMCP